MIALGWANVGAAVAPDAALASVASAIIMVLGLNGGTVNTQTAISTSIAVAIPLSVAGLFLTMICRTIAIPLVHLMDGAAEKGDFRKIEIYQILGILLQGVRIAVPAAALCIVPAEAVTNVLNQMPAWLSGGMTVGGGMVAAVGYAMVINMMSTKETWPFFAIGFVLAALSQLTLIALGALGVAIALIYLGLKENGGSGNGGSTGSGDPLGDILNDYGGWCYSIIPAIKKLYKDPQERADALKRHLEFYNTHPYVSAPVMGVTLALEEERANGAEINNQAIQGVKVGMMGPLAGVGDPVFWFTLRPILGALGASLALGGSIVGPLLFFFAWNIIRMAFIWYTQEFGYKVGTSIAQDLSGGLLGKITQGASILGMVIIGSLVQRWVSISFTPVVSRVTQSEGAYIDWNQIKGGAEGIKSALSQYASLGANGLDKIKVTTLQQNLDQLIPGLAALLLTLLCCWLLKKKVSPIVIIVALFIVGILARLAGIM